MIKEFYPSYVKTANLFKEIGLDEDFQLEEHPLDLLIEKQMTEIFILSQILPTA